MKVEIKKVFKKTEHPTDPSKMVKMVEAVITPMVNLNEIEEHFKEAFGAETRHIDVWARPYTTGKSLNALIMLHYDKTKSGN